MATVLNAHKIVTVQGETFVSTGTVNNGMKIVIVMTPVVIFAQRMDNVQSARAIQTAVIALSRIILKMVTVDSAKQIRTVQTKEKSAIFSILADAVISYA